MFMADVAYRRILLKLSGEALAGAGKTGVDFDYVLKIGSHIKTCVEKGVQIAIVVGGGNYWRGRSNQQMDRTRADYIGMLATTMNALTVQDALLQSGVRIYRYTPGFIHAKLCVADGQRATVGTVNLDYRSFYLHYEDGVLFTGGPVPGAVEADILQTLSRCEELRYDAWRRRPALQKAVQPLLRIFAPMM